MKRFSIVSGDQTLNVADLRGGGAAHIEGRSLTVELLGNLDFIWVKLQQEEK